VDDKATALQVQSPAIERRLQRLIEKNLELLLGVRFLRTEYVTGKVHNGRIDTLGLDENNTPVIIEYKRHSDENVINQGLFYLDWLLDHRAEFRLIVSETLGAEAAANIDWTQPRVICIAADFNRFDEHAVQQIRRNIDLVRYRHYGEDLLLLEKANGFWASAFISKLPVSEAGAAEPVAENELSERPEIAARQIFAEKLQRASPELAQLWQAVEDFMLGLGDDVERKQLKYYVAFRRLRNFATAEVHPVAKVISVFLKLDVSEVTFEEGFLRDVTEIGHFGTGDVEVSIRTEKNFEDAKPWIMKAYAAE
jgi:predicted transport protein